MKRLRLVVSLTTHDNDFQMEQAAAAQQAANRLGVDIDVVYADHDGIQLVKFPRGETRAL